jgi:hypothetical protein
METLGDLVRASGRDRASNGQSSSSESSRSTCSKTEWCLKRTLERVEAARLFPRETYRQRSLDAPTILVHPLRTRNAEEFVVRPC